MATQSEAKGKQSILPQESPPTSEAINNTDLIYFVRAHGDSLYFKSPGVIVPMTGATSVVEFEMVKAN